MRASFSSRRGSGDSFQVLVRWKVMSSSARIWRSRSRDTVTFGPVFVARYWASLRMLHLEKGMPRLVGRCLAVVMMSLRCSVVIRRGRPPAH
jgi:hypothetical protein